MNMKVKAMTTRKPGKVLQDYLLKTKEDSIDFNKKKGKSPFAHPVRREIFEYLCKYPCSSAGNISSHINLCEQTTLWHIHKLFEAGYIKKVLCCITISAF